jgi:hypothetical protein
MISGGLDNIGTASMLFAVTAVLKNDRENKRCGISECNLNLFEFYLDVSEALVKKGKPKPWSPLIADHIERAIETKFATEFLVQIDKTANYIQKKRGPAGGSFVELRLQRDLERYGKLRPMMQKLSASDENDPVLNYLHK